MRAFVVTTFGLALFAQATLAQVPTVNQSCVAPLKALTDEWNAKAFQSPSKPSQSIVVGAHGDRLTGMEFRYIEGQIRLASQDCRAGRDDASLRRIANVRKRLSESGGDIRSIDKTAAPS